MICTCQENRVKYYPCLNGSLHVSGGLRIHWKLWVRTCSLRVVDTNIPCGLLKWSRPKAMVKPQAILVHWETTVSHSRNLIPRDGIRKGSWGRRNNHKTALWSNVCPFTKSSTALQILGRHVEATVFNSHIGDFGCIAGWRFNQVLNRLPSSEAILEAVSGDSDSIKILK